MVHGVYLVEDHLVVRDAFAELIDSEGDLAVLGAAASAEVALAELPHSGAEIALVDVSLGDRGGLTNGIELVGRLHELCPDLRVLVVSGHDETVYAEPALEAGARGYLMKNEAVTSLLDAIRAILSGTVFVSARMRERLPAALTASDPG